MTDRIFETLTGPPLYKNLFRGVSISYEEVSKGALYNGKSKLSPCELAHMEDFLFFKDQAERCRHQAVGADPMLQITLETLAIDCIAYAPMNLIIRTKKAGLTKEWVIQRLMWLAERSLRGKPMMDVNGKHTGEFTGKPDGPTAVRSLELLGRDIGMFIDRYEIGEPGQFARMTDEELEASLAMQVRALGLPEEAINLLLSNRMDGKKH